MVYDTISIATQSTIVHHSLFYDIIYFFLVSFVFGIFVCFVVVANSLSIGNIDSIAFVQYRLYLLCACLPLYVLLSLQISVEDAISAVAHKTPLNVWQNLFVFVSQLNEHPKGNFQLFQYDTLCRQHTNYIHRATVIMWISFWMQNMQIHISQTVRCLNYACVNFHISAAHKLTFAWQCLGFRYSLHFFRTDCECSQFTVFIKHSEYMIIFWCARIRVVPFRR